MGINSQHIDAVITWVDGNDQQHYEKRRKIVDENKEIKESVLPTGKDNTRFVDNGELKYCLQSIRKFAPWIRTIHLVTDNQRPDFLTEQYQKENGIEFLNHQDIFSSYEWALPTFNSRTIETALWRIPDLSNHFIYFNDDFILTSSVKPEHFFPDGKVLLRGKWNTIKNYGSVRLKINDIISILSKKILGITRSMHLLQQIKSAQLAGFRNKYYRSPHVPHPIIKSSLAKFFSKNQESFQTNIQYKFRNVEQFSAIFLAHHIEISKGNTVLKKPDDFLILNGEMDLSFTLIPKLKKVKNGDAKFICLQGFEKYSRSNQKKIVEVLEDILESE
ncbi:MAG: hypothetical protein EA391_05310 [Balneolaceae bacterium]|nr:MAG: hypothetical protein EA391_05310 [Balneolaceae bacterium]